MQKVIEKYFNISPDASATVIITLLTFVLGYLITGLVFIIQGYFQRKSNRKIFLNNLEQLNRDLGRQQRALANTIATININKPPPWVYSRVDFFQVDVFYEMSYKEIFRSFFQGFENQFQIFVSERYRALRIRAYNKIWENLSNTKFWSEKAFNNFQSALDKFNEHNDKRSTSLNELRKMWEQLLDKAQNNFDKLDPQAVDYFDKLATIISNSQNLPTNERVQPHRIQRSLVLPMRILNRKYSTLPFTREFTDKAIEVSRYYREMENLSRNTKIQYEIYSHAFRTIQKTNDLSKRVLTLSRWKRCCI